MQFAYASPREQILNIISRIYRYGMTTTSGGNVSIRDSEGTIWITPAGVDKGSLQLADIVAVREDGSVEGPHRPSSELPFHKAIYEARPDLRGIVHAHPTALVAFSIARKLPPVRVIPQAFHLCENVGMAAYALPGSEELGKRIADTFAGGNESVMLENHGVVCGGQDLMEAFARFETLEYCGRLAISAARIGKARELSEEQVELRKHQKHLLPEFEAGERSSRELELRRQLCEMMRRAYDHQLVSSMEGIVSARLDGNRFLITPTGMDRQTLEPKDIVLIRDGKRERGKLPSRSVKLHQQIYQDHPGWNSVFSAQPVGCLSLAITDTRFATRTIPESYILLRDIARLPFGAQYTDEADVSSQIGPRSPVVLIENEAVVVAGKSLLEAYDRLEVAEFSANSLIGALAIGELVEMGDEEIAALKKAFLGE